jgi:hypothetical protein
MGRTIYRYLFIYLETRPFSLQGQKKTLLSEREELERKSGVCRRQLEEAKTAFQEVVTKFTNRAKELEWEGKPVEVRRLLFSVPFAPNPLLAVCMHFCGCLLLTLRQNLAFRQIWSCFF